MIITKILFILLCMFSLGACKEDYTYPNVLTELSEVRTDAAGKLKQLTTDDGSIFSIGMQPAEYKFRPDTLYRMLTVFEQSVRYLVI